jgi:hypothetical protein
VYQPKPPTHPDVVEADACKDAAGEVEGGQHILLQQSSAAGTAGSARHASGGARWQRRAGSGLDFPANPLLLRRSWGACSTIMQPCRQVNTM